MLSNLCPPSRLTSKKKLSYCPTTSPPFPPIKFQEKLHKKTMMIWKTRPTQNELLIFVVLWKLLFPILLFHVYICIYVSITWELYCPSCLICIKILLLLFLFSNFILFFNCSFLVYISFLCTQSLFERFRMDRMEY